MSAHCKLADDLEEAIRVRLCSEDDASAAFKIRTIWLQATEEDIQKVAELLVEGKDNSLIQEDYPLLFSLTYLIPGYPNKEKVLSYFWRFKRKATKRAVV